MTVFTEPFNESEEYSAFVVRCSIKNSVSNATCILKGYYYNFPTEKNGVCFFDFRDQQPFIDAFVYKISSPNYPLVIFDGKKLNIIVLIK